MNLKKLPKTNRKALMKQVGYAPGINVNTVFV